ncbi:peptidoglycan-binding protein [Flavobacterium tructae]|uniref:peptidoglycan-binding domain-containing protein n=1 Tax=Flavobacterium tructae TaxID=1114873 RepID=UPI0035A8F705
MKVKNEDKVLIGVGLVAVGGIGYLYWKKKQQEKNDDLLNAVPEFTPDLPKSEAVSIPNTGAVLNKNKMLGRGSKGIEVRELQRLLGVGIDGDFGTNTLSALQSRKGVSKISINAYLKTVSKSAVKEKPTALVIPRVGQKVMANQNNVSVFNAKKTASGSYFNSGAKPFIGGSFDYGEHIGVFVGSKVGEQYLINRDGVYYFVNASAVKGY